MMIRSVQPTSALPVTRNMPYYSASVPTKAQPRNMTGIYLGLEGNINPPQNRGFNMNRARKGTSQKVRTSAEDRRYKMVELLRIKEDARGFKGQPLKKRKPQFDEMSEDSESSVSRCSHPQQLAHRKWGPAKSANPKRFEDVIRQNPRNYTAINNNGVTRSENLTGMMSFVEQNGWDITDVPLSDSIVEEVKRIASAKADLQGLEECFKKVCKGNTESLHSLLPLRKGTARQDNYSTGFTVRSYRKPNNAELLADFDNPLHQQTRPKTVPATSIHPRQPLVPSPYFFKYYSKPGTAHSGKKLFEDPSQIGTSQVGASLYNEKIIGLPGSGSISRQLKNVRHSAWSEGDAMKIRRGSPRTDSPVKESGPAIHATSRHDNSPRTNQPLEIRAEGYLSNLDDKSTFSDRNGIVEPPNTVRSTDHTTTRYTDSTDRTNSKSERPESIEKFQITNSFSNKNSSKKMGDTGDNTIRLDLETADGKKQEIFIDDDKEVVNQQQNEKRRASEALVASLQEGARQRKLELEQILDEHAQIVTTIVRQASSESNNEAFQSAEVQRDQ